MKKIIVIFSILLSTVLSGCRDWLDINENPNYVSDADKTALLPTVALETADKVGYELSTPAEVIRSAETVIENDLIENIENGAAWHGGTAKAWANTSYSRILDPVCRSLYDGVVALRQMLGNVPELEEAMNAIESSYVSDSRWPPLPTSPGRFNVQETIDDLYAANDLLGKAMANGGIAEKRAVYSAPLMKTQIAAIETLLMKQDYFGEK